MKYVRLNDDNKIVEILPNNMTSLEIIEHWYGAEFASKCVQAPDEVRENWIYDTERMIFIDTESIPESEESKASRFNRIFTALVSDEYSVQKQLHILTSEFYAIAVAARMGEILSPEFTEFKDFLDVCERDAYNQIYGDLNGGEQHEE